MTVAGRPFEAFGAKHLHRLSRDLSSHSIRTVEGATAATEPKAGSKVFQRPSTVPRVLLVRRCQAISGTAVRLVGQHTPDRLP